ncbi:hypothetical protein WME89_40420 [Sorangium sp. So ce321]|uniref:hypothetical protein n=1 Tax=Sorangium sp. So ce321 TaxID=3133300 RepID=UPI003F61AE60
MALAEPRGVLGRASREEMLRPHVAAPEREGTQAIGFVHTELAPSPRRRLRATARSTSSLGSRAEARQASVPSER